MLDGAEIALLQPVKKSFLCFNTLYAQTLEIELPVS
jgi:hypothetical protein